MIFTDRIKVKRTGNVLQRYWGEPYTQVIHRDAQGNPITMTRIEMGDYVAANEHQTPAWLAENPNA